jgi:hypothetical protein
MRTYTTCTKRIRHTVHYLVRTQDTFPLHIPKTKITAFPSPDNRTNLMRHKAGAVLGIYRREDGADTGQHTTYMYELVRESAQQKDSCQNCSRGMLPRLSSLVRGNFVRFRGNDGARRCKCRFQVWRCNTLGFKKEATRNCTSAVPFAKSTCIVCTYFSCVGGVASRFH